MRPQHWHVLNLPAIAEPSRRRCRRFPATCTLEPDWRQPGRGALPGAVPAGGAGARSASRAGSYWWNALYQQRPSQAEGLLFQRALESHHCGHACPGTGQANGPLQRWC